MWIFFAHSDTWREKKKKKTCSSTNPIYDADGNCVCVFSFSRFVKIPGVKKTHLWGRLQKCLCCLGCFWPPRVATTAGASLVKWRSIKLDKRERNSHLDKTFWYFESDFMRLTKLLWGWPVVKFLRKISRHVSCTLHQRIGSGQSLIGI